METTDDKIYIEQMSELLDRAIHTIRGWVRDGFPDGHGRTNSDLMPEREGGRNKIYWVEAQVDDLRTYATERSARRGWQPAS